MIETFILTIRIQTAIDINSFIYMLKHLPLIKKIVKNLGYEHEKINAGLTILSVVKQLFMNLFVVWFFGFIGVLLPILILKEDGRGSSIEGIAYYLIIMFYYLLPCTFCHPAMPSKRCYLCVKLMNMNAKNYFVANGLLREILRLILELIVFLITAAWHGIPLLPIAVLMIGKHGARLCWDVFHLRSYQKKGKMLLDTNYFSFLCIVIILTAGYVPVFLFGKIPLLQVFPLLIGIGAIIGGVPALRWLNQYPLYRQLVNEVNKKDKLINDESDSEQATFQMVRIKEKDSINNRTFENREGFDYLNEIFFERHKRVLFRQIKIELIILPILTAGVLLVYWWTGELNKLGDLISHRFTIFIYVMSALSNAQKATQAMFFNCDYSLMRYGVYKRPDYILKSFILRVKKLILVNLLPAIELAACLFVVGCVTGTDQMELFWIQLLILVMSVFFVLHHMFLYYILQPYKTDMLIKNPVYKAINFITSLICLICLNVKSAPEFLLIPVIIITAAYSIIALACVYYKAPETFHLK